MAVYEEPLPIARDEAETIFRSQDRRAISDALVRVTFHDSDWRWVQDWCLRFAEHSDPELRGVAATCLGHLARIHRTLDWDKVILALERLRADRAVGGQAEDALADIRRFRRDDEPPSDESV